MTHITELAKYIEAHLACRVPQDEADRRAFGISGMPATASELLLVRLILAGRSQLHADGCRRVLYEIAERRCFTHNADFKPEWRLAPIE